MANVLALSMLRANLGFYDAALPAALTAELEHKLDAAEAALAEKRIVLNPSSVPDCELMAMYAAWLYRCKAGVQPQPQSLSYAIRNRQVHLSTEVPG